FKNSEMPFAFVTGAFEIGLHFLAINRGSQRKKSVHECSEFVRFLLEVASNREPKENKRILAESIRPVRQRDSRLGKSWDFLKQFIFRNHSCILKCREKLLWIEGNHR